MKLAKLFWSLGSILVNVTIGIYIYLQSNAPVNMVERYQYVNEKWSLYSGHWRAEFFIMTLIAIGAFYFASKLKNISWSIITVGQFIILLTYPFMLGGYRNTPFELAEMANQMATIVFLFGNVIFLGGLFHLYLTDTLLKPWLKYIAIILSGIVTIAFVITFAEVITWKEAMKIAPLINILYLINAYYGFKLKAEETPVPTE